MRSRRSSREEALALADRVERGEVTAAGSPVIAALVRQHVATFTLLQKVESGERSLPSRTDVVMLNVSGLDLAKRLRARYPQVKVLFMSGYTDDAVVRHGLVEADIAFSQKPYTPTELAQKVRQVIDESVAGSGHAPS